MHADEQYAANLAFLAQHPVHQAMYEGIRHFPMTNLKLMPTARGALYGELWDLASQQWVQACHPTDPVGHAEASVAQCYTPTARVFCVIGLGLGYNAVALARRLKPYQRLCIWEYDPTLFKAMLHAVDVTPLFTLPNVNMLIGNEIVHQVEPWWLQLQAPEKLAIQMPMREGYTTVYQHAAYDAIMTKTVDMLRFHAVGLQTWRLFGSHIGDNDLRNLPEYFRHPGYEHLTDLWKDRPAVCVAAGPSLQRNLAHLLPAAVRSHVALLTAGTTYALVQGLGLAPDIVTTIDFQRLNWTDQFQYVPLDPDCTLVYLHSTYPQTVRRWPGPRFVAENCTDTVTWMRQYGEGKQSAAEVQTVAHLSLKVALALGANPIILLGQDLSMPAAAHHAAGARAQDAAPNETPPEAWVTVPDFQGQPVLTRHSFLSMLTVFERLVADNPGTTFYNCSEAGLPIKGMQHRPLQEVLATFDTTPGPNLRALLTHAFRAYRPKVQETLGTDLATLHRHISDLARFATEMEALGQQGDAMTTAMLTAEHQAAMRAADVLSEEETVASFQSAVDREIAAYEHRILGERPAAWALFAIRRFDFIELLAEAPPPDETMAQAHHAERYKAERLVRIAGMIRESAPEVLRLVAEARHRLDVTGTDEQAALDSDPYRALMRQHYAAVRTALTRAPASLAPRTLARLEAQVLYHTQQYVPALALMDAWGFSPQRAARIRRHLATYQDAIRAALPAYFTTPARPSLGYCAPDLTAYY